VHERTVGKRLGRLGLSRLKPQPHHPKTGPGGPGASPACWWARTNSIRSGPPPCCYENDNRYE
jgi:hypothetical protein